MSAHWLILADDLTGAADCAIAFAKRGLHTTVRWQGEPEPAGEAVLSYDANSRGLPAEEAAARHAAVLGALHRPGAHLVKKIDSTLRGQPLAELTATLAHLRARTGAAFGILAPAFPGTGRTTEGGRIRVNGRPLEEAEVWRRDHTYASADLPAILDEHGIAAERIGLDTIRAGADALRAAIGHAAGRSAIAVCDAVSEDDLARIAAATCDGPLSRRACSGSARAASRRRWPGPARRRRRPLPRSPRRGAEPSSSSAASPRPPAPPPEPWRTPRRAACAHRPALAITEPAALAPRKRRSLPPCVGAKTSSSRSRWAPIRTSPKVPPSPMP